MMSENQLLELHLENTPSVKLSLFYSWPVVKMNQHHRNIAKKDTASKGHQHQRQALTSE